jgi:hypothetical protein
MAKYQKVRALVSASPIRYSFLWLKISISFYLTMAGRTRSRDGIKLGTIEMWNTPSNRKQILIEQEEILKKMAKGFDESGYYIGGLE